MTTLRNKNIIEIIFSVKMIINHIKWTSHLFSSKRESKLDESS
uniref:Uncharacterized protein n=1 Tax=Rhizophora mucronata TaxID=61149 RepID=A0A2P2PAH0_RHIMU